MTNTEDDAAPTKRRGRPSTGKRGTFSFRVTSDLRAKLEAAARAAERPVSEEIELRLERSFWEDGLRTLVVEAVREAKE